MTGYGAIGPAPGFDKFKQTPFESVIAGDADSFGQITLYGVTQDGVLQKWSCDADEWTVEPLGAAVPGSLARIDVNGSGQMQWLHGPRR